MPSTVGQIAQTHAEEQSQTDCRGRGAMHAGSHARVADAALHVGQSMPQSSCGWPNGLEVLFEEYGRPQDSVRPYRAQRPALLISLGCAAQAAVREIARRIEEDRPAGATVLVSRTASWMGFVGSGASCLGFVGWTAHDG